MTDLSKLIAAIKPNERSDQYLILAAMLALGAGNVPVTAKQISDLLTSHLGAKIPANINASLRAYTSYVVRRKGRPLRWLLVQNGIERLRQLRGLSLSTAADPEAFKSDIGILRPRAPRTRGGHQGLRRRSYVEGGR
jgi:hypothetical protein